MLCIGALQGGCRMCSRLAVLQRRVVQVQLAQLRGEVRGGGSGLLRWRPGVAARGRRRVGAAS